MGINRRLNHVFRPVQTEDPDHGILNNNTSFSNKSIIQNSLVFVCGAPNSSTHVYLTHLMDTKQKITPVLSRTRLRQIVTKNSDLTTIQKYT